MPVLSLLLLLLLLLLRMLHLQTRCCSSRRSGTHPGSRKVSHWMIRHCHDSFLGSCCPALCVTCDTSNCRWWPGPGAGLLCREASCDVQLLLAFVPGGAWVFLRRRGVGVFDGGVTPHSQVHRLVKNYHRVVLGNQTGISDSEFDDKSRSQYGGGVCRRWWRSLTVWCREILRDLV